MIYNFPNIDRDAWITHLIHSHRVRRLNGVLLPGFPPEDIQVQFVGSSNEHALQEVSGFYRIVIDSLHKFSSPITSQSRLLDFGTAWGRIQRFFLFDYKSYNVYGIDVDPIMIERCKKCMPMTNNFATGITPPTSFSNSTFHLIVAYSVFSHLSPSLHIHWLKEFSRLLAPNGLLAATTHSRNIFDLCRRVKQHGTTSTWERSLSDAFPDIEDAESRFDRGEIVFVPTGGGDFRSSEFYGDTLIPKQYVKRHWTPYLEFVDYIDAKSDLAQNLIIMKNSSPKRKVFILGWQKTGTTSIHRALEILGYRVLANVEYYNSWKAGAATLSDLLTVVNNYDATKDYPWSLLYKQLDTTFPNSQFILTIRDTESWFESLRQHITRNPGQPSNNFLYGEHLSSNFTQTQRAHVQRLYEQHNKSVLNYFSNRDDLLVLNLEQHADWENLCSFLDLDRNVIADQTFPRENVGNY